MDESHRHGIGWHVPYLLVVGALILLLLSNGTTRSKLRNSGTPAETDPETPEIAPKALPAESEQDTVQVFKRVSPSVVSVANKARIRGGFMGMQVYEIPRGLGSGFIWDKKGHLVSNFHVIEGASAIQVTLSDGSEYEAQVVGVAPDHDIAVLKIEAPAEKLTPIAIGTSKDLQVGQKVLAIGNPFGLKGSLTVGIVSSLGRSMRAATGVTIHDVIQTDAAINSGNSGGPLLDAAGRLIAINTAIISPSGGSVGLGFAIPVDTAREVVPQIITYGRVKRAGLGVELFPDYLARQFGVRGAIIRRVQRRGAAKRAGLRGTRGNDVGDIIVEIDGQPVRSIVELREILLAHRAGDEINVVYVRNHRKNEVTVKLRTLE